MTHVQTLFLVYATAERSFAASSLIRYFAELLLGLYQMVNSSSATGIRDTRQIIQAKLKLHKQLELFLMFFQFQEECFILFI